MKTAIRNQVDIINVNCNGEELLLSNLRCAFWPKEKTLILADLHIGKTAHFRRHGIAVPTTILHNDLRMLETAITYFSAEKIMVVGDMFHHSVNTDITTFGAWRKQYAHISFNMVKGNHDRLIAHAYQELGIEVAGNIFFSESFCFSHEPGCHNAAFVISGHVHPGVLLAGRGGQVIKLPCFIKSATALVLPAFSRFTGLDVRYNAFDGSTEKYAFTDTSIFKV